jgi:L-iditol 2-dehydrogenase
MGQGPIGLLFTQLARLSSADVIATDLLPARREMSVRFGAAAALSPEGADLKQAVMELTHGRGADHAILTIPESGQIAGALSLVRPGGRVLLFAQTKVPDITSIDAGQICALEKDLIGSYSSDITLQDDAAELIFSGAVDVAALVTGRFPLEQIGQALALAAGPSGSSLKIMVTP